MFTLANGTQVFVDMAEGYDKVIPDAQEALLDKLQEVISLSDELHQKKIERLELKIQELESVVTEFCELMDNSDGVSGLHLNGEIATWKELMYNGWLCNLKDHLEG